MEDILLSDFENIHDAIFKIDSLVNEANSTRKKVEKRQLLTKAQKLADAYQKHCEDGGNYAKQFKQIL